MQQFVATHLFRHVESGLWSPDNATCLGKRCNQIQIDGRRPRFRCSYPSVRIQVESVDVSQQRRPRFRFQNSVQARDVVVECGQCTELVVKRRVSWWRGSPCPSLGLRLEILEVKCQGWVVRRFFAALLTSRTKFQGCVMPRVKRMINCRCCVDRSAGGGGRSSGVEYASS